jgi:hypothetical protein
MDFSGYVSFIDHASSVVLFIMPPSGVVFIHFMAGLMICVGLAMGWAWGAITMKAALATRPQADLLQRYAELQQSMPQNTTNVGQASGQTTYQQIAIYQGFMLDTRVSVTYFCMMGLFVYLMVSLSSFVACCRLMIYATGPRTSSCAKSGTRGNLLHDSFGHLPYNCTTNSHVPRHYTEGPDSSKCHRSWRWCSLQPATLSTVHLTNYTRKHGRITSPDEQLCQVSELALQDES